MITIDNETLSLIKEDIDKGKVPSAGFLIAEYVKNKNPHENITLALRSIKEDLKEILSHYPESFIFGQIHFNILHEVIEELEWKLNFDNMDFNGWPYDIFIPIEIPNKDFYYTLECSWYNPLSHLEKIYKNETKSNNR